MRLVVYFFCLFLVAKPNLIFKITLMLGLNVNGLMLNISVTLTHLPDCKTSTDVPQLPRSAGISLETTWLHLSTQMCSKISQTRHPISIWCMIVESKSLHGNSSVSPHEDPVEIYCERSAEILFQSCGKKRRL